MEVSSGIQQTQVQCELLGEVQTYDINDILIVVSTVKYLLITLHGILAQSD